MEASGPSPAHAEGPTFHEILSALNPLQYLPGIGTIYRAVTGDTIPEPLREIGSLVVSGLMGGPVGMALNLGLLACEKLTGIDPEEIGQHMLASLHLTPHETGPEAGGVAQTSAPLDGAGVPAPSLLAPSILAPSTLAPSVAWSPAALAAYGISQAPGGVLSMGDVHGADVLNAMELARITQHA